VKHPLQGFFDSIRQEVSDIMDRIERSVERPQPKRLRLFGRRPTGTYSVIASRTPEGNVRLGTTDGKNQEVSLVLTDLEVQDLTRFLQTSRTDR
jgi:hypothetical protein